MTDNNLNSINTVELPPNWQIELVTLLKRQISICTQLHECSNQQTCLLQADKAEQLLTVLSNRQNLIDELIQLSISLEPFRSAWPEIWESLTETERNSINNLIGKSQQLVDEIIGIDKKSQDTLIAEQNHIKKQLIDVNTAQTTARAYDKTSNCKSIKRTNRFMDEQA